MGVVGKVQLRQKRVIVGQCSVGDVLDGYLRLPCRLKDDNRYGARYGPEPSVDVNESQDASFVVGGLMTKQLLVNKDLYYSFLEVVPLDAGVKRAEFLEAEEWCDRSTDWVEARFVLLNGEVQAFTEVAVTFDFIDGGEIYTKLEVNPVHIPQWATPTIIVDCLWAFLMLTLILITIQEVLDSKKHRSVFHRCCLSVWMALDWLGIICGIAIIVVFFMMRGFMDSLHVRLALFGQFEYEEKPVGNSTNNVTMDEVIAFDDQ